MPGSSGRRTAGGVSWPSRADGGQAHLFSAAASHSGYGHPDHNPYTDSLFSGDHALQRANTPDDYLATIPISRTLGVYLDAGLYSSVAGARQ